MRGVVILKTNISVAEAKNKLPYFIHLTEQSGPVVISRRNKDVAVLISKKEYEDLVQKAKSNSILARTENFRNRNKELFSNQDIDNIFSATKEDYLQKQSSQKNIFDGVLE